MLEEIKKDASQRMDKALQVLKTEFAKVRTGRASAGLLDHVRVDYYGNPVPISQAANVVVEDARTISITPWEKPMMQAIEKAIMASDLGLTPNTAGNVIRIIMPALTEERRRELTKVIRHEGEVARVAIRNVRRDALQTLKEKAKKLSLPQDQEKRIETEVQKLTDAHIAQVDAAVAAKEKETMSL